MFKKEWKSGPKIKVTIHTNDNLVSQVILSLRKKEGIEIAIDGANIPLRNVIVNWIDSYLSGKKSALPPLQPISYPQFTQNVLHELLTIPFGHVISYKDLAALMNAPHASRAVGQACGRNPYPLFLPCHRVIASDGKLGGFSGGLDIKSQLLEFENLLF